MCFFCVCVFPLFLSCIFLVCFSFQPWIDIRPSVTWQLAEIVIPGSARPRDPRYSRNPRSEERNMMQDLIQSSHRSCWWFLKRLCDSYVPLVAVTEIFGRLPHIYFFFRVLHLFIDSYSLRESISSQKALEQWKTLGRFIKRGLVYIFLFALLFGSVESIRVISWYNLSTCEVPVRICCQMNPHAVFCPHDSPCHHFCIPPPARETLRSFSSSDYPVRGNLWSSWDDVSPTPVCPSHDIFQ